MTIFADISGLVSKVGSMERKLRAIEPQLVEDAMGAVLRVAEAAADNMRTNCPVATGDLRDSITVERTHKTRVEVQVGGDGVDYAAAVEYGTSNAPAQPFIRPAAQSAGGQLGAAVRSAL